MIKFIKREWIKICLVLIGLAIILGYIWICDSIAKDFEKIEKYITEDSYETDTNNKENITNKNNIKVFLDETNESVLQESILSRSNRALANIEYLKLEEMEKITEELKRFNDNYKKTVLYENGLSDTLDLE